MSNSYPVAFLLQEYELSTEFVEALEHASEEARNTKVILKMNDVGITC